MTLAHILINTELGKEEDVLEELRSLDAYKESYLVFGVYDIILKVEAENQQALKDTVFTKIRRMDNVRTTLTMLVVD